MKCPHCQTGIHANAQELTNRGASDGNWHVLWQECPECKKSIFRLLRQYKKVPTSYLAYPAKVISRNPVSADVPDKFGNDYKEACLVLADSPKASAALSRRCLQHVLQEKGGVKKKNLADQIDEVMPSLPSALAEMIDAVRVMGNFAAHPIKSTNTGEIVEVEPTEAEWLLDTLEMLFDHYFVKPAEIQRRRDAIGKKAKEAGKPPLK